MSFAPGKILLFGEHSVVYGEPSIVASLDEGIAVDLEPRREASNGDGDHDRDASLDRAIALAAEAAGVDPERYDVRIRSDLPAGVGLGSSAALSVALVRAFAAATGANGSHPSNGNLSGESTHDAEDVWRRAWLVENVFHGTSSGVDVAAAAYGGLLWYERDRPPVPLEVPEPVDVVVAIGRRARRTEAPVSDIRERARRLPAMHRALVAAAGEAARGGAAALRRADWGAAGDLMNVAHGLLAAFGVSTGELDDMTRVAREAGAAGAKLSGAGGGGSIVALAPGNPRDVAEALEAHGATTLIRTIGNPRQEVHDGIDELIAG